MDKLDFSELIQYIDPVPLSYQEWVNVGMALKHEGLPCSVWDSWSRADSGRYHTGECERKWETFTDSGTSLVTGGTLVELAKRGGWTFSPREGHEIGWDDYINNDGVIVDTHYLEPQELYAPQDWQPEHQLITYLQTLFNTDDKVGYSTRSREQDGRRVPSKGHFDRTAGQLIEQLSCCGGDVGKVIGDYDPAVGAWIRFNPLDGKGVKNENVTEFRYALVESDSAEIEKQNAILRELELPIACLVHSGNKSLHAIVRVEAADYAEYKKRVNYLYEICKKNGLDIDTQNRNPSRLSRIPGVIRNGKKQYLIDTNIGKSSWLEWVEWIESVNDDLPDPESLADFWNDMPELSPALIDGVLRQGHKMLLAGPSKAGKSFALIELCCAIAEGRQWLGFSCTQGKIMYVNLELDKASCLHRFADVYKALGWSPDNIANIDIWNLRGYSIPMTELTPELIRKAARKNYIAIVIDPIYKVITGDENSADQMARFCNQFDKVCTELGCAVIYCHHHSKGAQSGKKSMDRASGSGVFARDPDALLDLIELEQTESMVEQEEKKRVCQICADWLKKFAPDKLNAISSEDRYNSKAMIGFCRNALPSQSFSLCSNELAEARSAAQMRTAWRIEATLREFPKFPPINMWFDYPVHVVDTENVLKCSETDANDNSPRKQIKSRDDRKSERMRLIEDAYEIAAALCGENESVTVSQLMECSSLTRNSVKNYIDEHPGFKRDDKGIITKLSKCQNE